MEIAEMCENCDYRTNRHKNHIRCKKRGTSMWRGFKCPSYRLTTNKHILAQMKRFIEELPPEDKNDTTLTSWLRNNGLVIDEDKGIT